MTFQICYAGSNYPYFISYRGKWVYLFYRGCTYYNHFTPKLEDMKLNPEETSTSFSGCEFDYCSNTYRVQVTVNVGSVTVGQNFITVCVDGATGMPKVSAVN